MKHECEVIKLDRSPARYARSLDETNRELEGWVAFLVSSCSFLAMNGAWAFRKREIQRMRDHLSPSFFYDCPDPRVGALARLAGAVEKALLVTRDAQP